MLPTAARRLAVSSQRAATSSSLPPNVAEAAQQLLPPIQLYRTLLRAHRRLPEAERSFGDRAIKEEFRRHRKVDNPLHLIQFLSQWKAYSDAITGAEPGQIAGRPLGETLEKLNAEQLGQLYELMQATRDVWKPVEETDPILAESDQPIVSDTPLTGGKGRS